MTYCCYNNFSGMFYINSVMHGSLSQYSTVQCTRECHCIAWENIGLEKQSAGLVLCGTHTFNIGATSNN